MSNSQLDDLNEQQGNEIVAEALKISTDDLEELDCGGIETNESSDGIVYGYYMNIQKDGSSEEVLEKVKNNVHHTDYGSYITVDLQLKSYPDDDEYYEEDKPENDTTPIKPKGGHRLF